MLNVFVKETAVKDHVIRMLNVMAFRVFFSRKLQLLDHIMRRLNVFIDNSTRGGSLSLLLFALVVNLIGGKVTGNDVL